MGFFLNSTSDLVQLVTGGTQVVHVATDWIDVNGTSPATATFTPGRQDNAAINSATTTTIVPSPGSSVTRNIKNVVITNTDSSNATTITVQRTDGTNTTKIKASMSLPALCSLNYADGRGWYVTDANGVEQVDNSSTSGLYVQTQTLTSGTSGNFSSRTNKIRARVYAAGGQGGGGGGTTGFDGSGGGSGGWAEYEVAVTPGASFTYAIGAGGSTGGTGAGGQAGGNTTLTIGGTTVTANGGGGGAVGTSASIPVLGGPGGAISTNGTRNYAGQAGEPPTTTGTAANNRSGFGAPSPVGGGGAAALNASNATGNNAVGFGAGGGGGTTTGTARAGGTGAPGLIVIDEYT